MLAVSIGLQYGSVTDGRTDGQTDIVPIVHIARHHCCLKRDTNYQNKQQYNIEFYVGFVIQLCGLAFFIMFEVHFRTK